MNKAINLITRHNALLTFAAVCIVAALTQSVAAQSTTLAKALLKKEQRSAKRLDEIAAYFQEFAEPRGYLGMIQTPDNLINLVSSKNHYQFNLAWLLDNPAFKKYLAFIR